MTEQFREISRLLRSQGYKRGADLTDYFEEELRARNLIPPTLFPHPTERVLRVDDVLRRTALEIVNEYLGFDVSEEMLIGKSREREIAQTRHLVSHLMYKVGGLTLANVAASLGRINHTTTINSLQHVYRMTSEPSVKKELDILAENLRGRLDK